MGKFGTLKFTGLMIIIAALLHFVAPVFDGFGETAMGLLPFGVVGIIVGFLIMRFSTSLTSGLKRLLLWPLFILLLFGTIMPFLAMFDISPVPSRLFGAIAFVRLIALLSLFVHLWRSLETREAKEAG